LHTLVRLTRPGILVLLVALSMAVAGSIVGAREALGLGVFLTGSVTASMAYSILAASSSRVVVEREVHVAREASKGSVIVRVRNESQLPVFWLSLEDDPPPGVLAYARPRFFSPTLPGGSYVEAVYRVTARMGTHCFPRPRLRFRDPLGLAEADLPVKYTGARCVSVKPRAVHREEVAKYLTGRRMGEGAVRDKGFGIELYQFR
jgi:uncharacterized protein (DUF58 family)